MMKIDIKITVGSHVSHKIAIGLKFQCIREKTFFMQLSEMESILLSNFIANTKQAFPRLPRKVDLR